jgi:TonB family protein
MSVPSYESFALHWMDRVDDETLFRKIYRALLIFALLFGLIIGLIPLAKEERKEREPLPPRLVKFIEEQKKQPPAPPPVVKPVEKPKPKPKPVERPKPKPKKPLTKSQEKAREKASKSGIVALSNELSDLIDTPAITELVNTRVTKSGRVAAKEDTSVLTSSVGKGSGGVSTKNLDRSVSTTSIGSRSTTKVQSAEAVATVASEKKGGGRKAGRSEEEITLVIDRNKGKIYSTYRRELRRNPTLQGRVVLEITILPSGKVKDVNIVSSELKDKRFEAALIRRFKLLNFGAKDVDTVTVTYPLEFFPT